MTNDTLIRAEFNLPDADIIKPEKLQPHIDSAVTDAKRMLGEDLYNTIAGEDDTTTRRKDCTKGMTYLAMAYAVFSLNMETSGSGIVTSKGFDQSRSELMSFSAVKEMAEYYRQQATKFFQPYFPTATPAEDDDEETTTIQIGNSFMTVI